MFHVTTARYESLWAIPFACAELFQYYIEVLFFAN